jgi:hypothetical protein
MKGKTFFEKLFIARLSAETSRGFHAPAKPESRAMSFHATCTKAVGAWRAVLNKFDLDKSSSLAGQGAIGLWGEAGLGFEDASQMALISEAGGQGDLCDGLVG